MISLKGAPVILAGVFDLTERKKAEEELRLASEILQRVKSLVVVADAEGKVQYVGPSSKEILGYASDELLGEEWWNKTQTDPAERERQKSYVVRAARGDGPILLEPYERTLVSQDGETHWIVWQDAHGPGKTLIGVGHDITDRKRAEEIIRKNEKRFRALIENSSDVTAIIGPDAVIHYISPSITRIFGYPEDELVGHNAFDFIHPDDHEHVMQRLLELLRDPIQNAPVEFRALRKDGAWLHTEAIASNQLDEPSIRGVIINYRDISERKRAEERVAASEKRFRALIENSADAISMIDRQGKILYVSPAVQRIFGYAPDDPSSIQNLSDVIHPDDLPMFGQVMAQLLQAPGAAVNATLRERTRDGRWLWVEGIATNLLDEPSVQAIVINFRDVTERKQAELALAQSEERYRLVTELASDYAYAYRLDEPGKAVLEWVTDAYERITGYTLAEVNETGAWQKLVHPDDLPIAYAHTERLNAGEASEVEYRILTKQGETRWLRDLMRPLEDETTGRVVRVYGAAQDITERKRAEEQIRHQLGQLGSLRVIDNAISNSLDLRVTMEVFLQQVTEQLKVDAAEVMLFNQTSQVIEATARRGFRRRALENTRIRLGQGIVGRAVLERELIQIPDLALEQSQLVRQWLVTEEGFASYFAAPLIAKGQVKGVLNVYHRVPREVNSDWLDFFIALAGQAAIAIDNAQLFENLQRSNFELGLAYDTTLEGWSRALDLRDKETEGHTQRVTELTLKLAARMGMSKEDLAEVRRGALLHDIGKMGVPDSVLLKPDKLSEEEWVVMRKHPVYAFELLAPIKYLAHALDIPYCHHEKWDGTGYPRGLKGEQIPLAARLFAIVDVWDAIRSDRPYRKAWSTDEAREHILALSGTHFDPRVVQVFLQMIATAPDGTSPLA